MSGRRTATDSNNTRGRLAGRVVDPTGRPVEEAHVLIVSGPTHPDIAAITGPDGRFALGGLLPGRYRVRAEAAGFDPRVVEMVAVAGLRVDFEIALDKPEQDGEPDDRDDSRLDRWRDEAEEIPGSEN